MPEEERRGPCDCIKSIMPKSQASNLTVVRESSSFGNDYVQEMEFVICKHCPICGRRVRK